MDKIWEIKPRKYDDIIMQLLVNRGVISRENQTKKIDQFFNPDFENNMNDPNLLPDIEKAVKRIRLAINSKEKIGIYADYDADGIPGAAYLYKALRQLGIKTEIYIPNREEGYGLNSRGIDYLAHLKCSLIITVDLGIRNIKEAEYCKKINIDLIITDHHLPDVELPSALAVVNPMRKDSRYPFSGLSGAGVTFKLVCGLSKYYKNELDEKFLKWNLDLIAISTIADVVPLLDENRTIAKFGLVVLGKTRNLGLQELISAASINPKNIQSYTVAFQIAPRINAPGRVDHASKSFKLLVTDDRQEAKELARWLNDKNTERQQAMDEIFNQSIAQIEKHRLFENNIISVRGDWPKGVLGPSASQIVGKYFKPTLVFSSRGDMMTGSARSVEGVNIVEIFEKFSKYLIRFGGHKGAAGLSLKKSAYDSFFKKLVGYGSQYIDEKLLIPKLKADLEVLPKELNLSLYDQISKFEPFGMSNSKPVFVLRSMTMEYPRFVGKEEKHLSVQLASGNNRFKSIYFSYEEDRDIIKHGNVCDAVFTLSEDNWNNERRLSLSILDIKHHKS